MPRTTLPLETAKESPHPALPPGIARRRAGRGRRPALPSPKTAAGLGCVALCWVSLGCTGGDEVDDDDLVQTAVVVDPAELLGTVPCAAIQGAARSYVATLVDVDTGERVGPSSPVTCGAPLAFHAVEVTHRYGAEVSVFDVPAEQAGGTPRWSTTCGLSGAGAAEVVVGRQTRVRGCTPLAGPGAATTSVAVDATAAAAELGCVASGGLVDAIDIVPVEPAGVALPPVTIGCGQPAVLYGTDIEPSVLYAFRLEARRAGSATADFGARCTAVARDGLAVEASCALLVETGTLRFPIPDLTEAAGLSCGSSVSRATISGFGADATIPTTSVPCDGPASASSLPPGAYASTVGLYAGPELRASFSCAGSVLPGVVTEPTCIAN